MAISGGVRGVGGVGRQQAGVGVGRGVLVAVCQQAAELADGELVRANKNRPVTHSRGMVMDSIRGFSGAKEDSWLIPVRLLSP